MTIKLSYGCTTAAFTMDGVPIETREQELELFERIVPRLRSAVARGELQVRSVIELVAPDDHWSGETCEQCGDWPSRSTWHL